VATSRVYLQGFAYEGVRVISMGYKKPNFAEQMFETSAVFNGSLEDCFCFVFTVVFLEGCYVTPFLSLDYFYKMTG
jgi:hypothetical protein